MMKGNTLSISAHSFAYNGTYVCTIASSPSLMVFRSEIFTREAMDDGMYNISFSHSHGGSLGSFTFIPRFVFVKCCLQHVSTDVD